MKKFNLSNIMKNAWAIRRASGSTMSVALRKAWSDAKNPSYVIKPWFLSKNFTDGERFAMSSEKPSIVRETEKAIQFCWETNYGKIIRWVPKSCIMTVAEIAAENTAEKCSERLAAMNARQSSYDALIAECRANGIPARKGWRASTMRQKLAAVSA